MQVEALLLVLGLAFASSDTLLSVQLLYRHGDRTPITTYPTDPNNDVLFLETQPGQLTNVGKDRQYKFGQWLRTRYSDFLSPTYSPKEFKIITSDVDRCHMSAQSNLAGLFPPVADQLWEPTLNWQPIPIHVNMPVLYSPTDCPRYDTLTQQLIDSEAIKEQMDPYQEQIAYTAQNSGSDLSGEYGVLMIRDTLYIENLLGLPLPSWTSSVFPDPLEQLAALWYSYGSYTDELKTLSIGPFFNELITNFDNVQQKFIEYSSHDNMVANVLHTVVPTYPNICPKFASSTIFELWQGSTQKYVKLIFKSEDSVEELIMKGCGNIKCPLDKFKKLLSTVALTVDERDALCKKPV